jgi:putative tricarboxylic transport membrane protein
MHSLLKSKAIRFAVVAFVVVVGGMIDVQAADWKPNKPVQVIVPYAAGGGSDVLARSFAQVIDAEKLNPTQLIIVNQPGGSGTIGTTNVAQAKGNATMLLTFISGQVAGPLLAGKGAATYKDLTLLGMLAIDEQLIVVKQDSPFKTIKDVVAAAKQKTLSIAGTATGQEDQMCNRLFEKAADIKLRYVPFNSGGECITALLGGHVDMIWANPSEFVPQYDAKMCRPLAVAKEVRLTDLPDVPTFKENGYNVTFKMFRGIAAPTGIPAEAAAYYENLFKKMTDSPKWKENYLKKYMLSASWMGSKEFGKFVAESEEMFRGILKELGLLK